MPSDCDSPMDSPESHSELRGKAVDLIPRRARRSTVRWHPTKYMDKSIPPPLDESGQRELTALTAAFTLGYEVAKPRKTTERRTIDYNGAVTRWRRERTLKSSIHGQVYMRPSINHIIELLPPMAYQWNPSVSYCGKFVHTSINKVRTVINALSWTPDGHRLLTGGNSGEFTLWNGLTFNYSSSMMAHDAAIRDIVYTKSGKFIISTDTSGCIKYFSPSMTLMFSMQGHREAVRGLAISPNDEKFVTASDDRLLKIWNIGEKQPLREMTGHNFDIKAVDWHPTRGLIVSGSRDHSVMFHDPRTSSVITTLHNHKDSVQSTKFSFDGNLCATGSRDGTIRLFDLRTLTELRVLRGHKDHVICMEWHPVHHTMLTSGGADKSIMYWDTAIDTPTATIEFAHEGPVTCLAWHPLGSLLSSGSVDFNTRFWSRERPGVPVGRDRYHLGAQKAAELGIKDDTQVDNDDSGGRGSGFRPPGLFRGGRGGRGGMPGIPGLGRPHISHNQGMGQPNYMADTYNQQPPGVPPFAPNNIQQPNSTNNFGPTTVSHAQIPAAYAAYMQQPMVPQNSGW